MLLAPLAILGILVLPIPGSASFLNLAYPKPSTPQSSLHLQYTIQGALGTKLIISWAPWHLQSC